MSKPFKDRAGKQWIIDINVDSVKRVRALCEVDLLAIADGNGQLIGRLTTDPVLLVDVLYAVCKPEAEAAGVSDVDFGRAMSGDVIEQATQSLMEDLADFFPSGRRGLLKQALAKIRETEAAVIARASREIAKIEIPGDSSTVLPGDSASIPGR